MKARPQTARRLRRNQTDAERKLWFVLRDRRLGSWKFRRQFPIDRFVVNFFCADAHLIVELDGGQHAVRTEADAQRTKILEAMGYLVLRFWNNDVMQNIDGVQQEINAVLERHRSEPTPLLDRQGAQDNGLRQRVADTSPRRGEVERAKRARVRGFGRFGCSQSSDPPERE
jgi:very-short-patch-repair endonuclease